MPIAKPASSPPPVEQQTRQKGNFVKILAEICFDRTAHDIRTEANGAQELSARKYMDIVRTQPTRWNTENQF